MAGCAVAPEYQEPSADLPGSYTEGGSRSAENVAQAQWWIAFGDAHLNRIIERGLAQNLDVKAALERVEAARSAARGAGVPLTGDITLEAGGRGGSNISDDYFSSAEASASWLLDFFGQLGSERAAAQANLDAAADNVETARLAFLSEVASAYIDARFFQESIALTRRNLASRRKTLELTNALLEAAAATRLDVKQAEGLVNETLAELPPLEAGFLAATFRLSTLIGEPAGSLVSELSHGAPQPYPRRIGSAGVPADLVRNRPDIRAAERRLAAAVAETGVAQARLYPSISLDGRITALNFGGTDTTTWQFGPVLNLPIFGREALQANVGVAEARARERLVDWQAAVLNAVEEVEVALTASNRDRRAIAAQRRAVGTFEESLGLAQSSYEEGQRSILDVLDAERSVASARIDLARANQRYALDFVALNVAIGGGAAFGSNAGEGS